jgi:YHS domain-containing protein
MVPASRLLSWVIAVGLTAVLSGCGTGASHEEQKPAKPSEDATQSQSAQPGGQSKVSSPDPAKGLAELSEADAALAKKQRVCPVSGEVLGAMGKPYKVMIKGKTVFLCCSGCEAALRKHPDKYLSKLEK